ncbi:MAG TPA: hypothetical protein VLT45_10175 [Kofleriaceae bacterium]|nr:hypothetical protein [Kofleriaceae bacterium]
MQEYDGDVPKLDERDAIGHIVLERAGVTTLDLLVAGSALSPWHATWSTSLPDEYITPPRWVHTQIGARVGWLQRFGNRFVPDSQLYSQVEGARIAQIFGQEYAIGYVHGIPAIGELVMVGEAVVGKEIVTGRKLSTQERVLYLAFGAVAAALGGASVVSANRLALAREAKALAAATGMSEIDATALLRATANLSQEERSFLAEARATAQAGKSLTKDEIRRATTIFEHLEADVSSIKASLQRAKAAAPVAPGAALGKDALVIDANTAIALNKRSLGLPLQLGEQALLKRLDALGASEYRVVNVTAGEVKTGDVAWRGLELTTKRSSREYQKLLKVLDRYDVGGAKGIPDRAIVADVFFSQTEPGVVPRFATHDRGVYNNLFRITGVDPKTVGKPLAEAFANGFDVTINGRTATIVPLPSK